MRSRGLCIVAVVGLVGQLCVPRAAQDSVTKADILDAVGEFDRRARPRPCPRPV